MKQDKSLPENTPGGMSDRAVRPKFHFAPQQGWINDPNGLILLGDTFHLFYQYFPDGMVWGPMHWGHAVTKDLANWHELDLALGPDEQGNCFSGSAVSANEGTVAEELKAEGAEILLFYTAHLPRAGLPGLETQCLAIGDGSLRNIRRFDGNPVLANPGIADFRDPKVIWHAPTQRWIMVITHGQTIGIYSSADATQWHFESAFGSADGRHGNGPWECPSLFPIGSVDGGECWVLLVGVGDGHFSGGSGTQYFVGTFDGRLFKNLNTPEVELWLDHGRDCYAAQTFSGVAQTAPLMIAWMSNWDYAAKTPAVGYRGQMCLPRRLELAATVDGQRLRQRVDNSTAEAFDHQDLRLTAGEARRVWRPSSGTFRLTMSLERSAGEVIEICLFGEDEPHFQISGSGDGHAVRCLRADIGMAESRGQFASDFEVNLGPAGQLELDLFVDNGLVECGFNDGLVWISMIYFPSDAAGAVSLVRLKT